MTIETDFKWVEGEVQKMFGSGTIQVCVAKASDQRSGVNFERRLRSLTRYILHTVLAYSAEEIATIAGCDRRSVTLGLPKIEDARDIPDLDRALDEIELAALRRIRDSS